MEITLAGGDAIRMSHAAQDVGASFLDWLKLGRYQTRDRGTTEWESPDDEGGR